MENNIIDGFSMNVEALNKDKLKSVFPECFAEGKLDIDKLLSLCGEYIDNDFEKYSFTWKGKADCLKLAQKRSTGTLRPCPEESVNFDTTQNLYIEGDNLEVLKLLQTSYYRKVKMIYIDPPYNTGNDFVYEDDFADPMARYKEVTQQTTKSNPETMGRYHTNWLNMMYPRLRLAANLLRDDGVIFISIDDNEVTNLRKICDEVFGEENFVGQLIIQTATDNNPRQISTEHEYMVCYAKRKDLQGFWEADNEKAQLIIDKYNSLKSQYCDDITMIQLKLREWIKSNKDKLEGVAHYDNVDDHGVFHDADVANTVFGGYEYNVIHPVTGKPCKIPDKGFRFSEETMKEMIANGDIMFGVDETTLIKPKKRIENAKDVLRSVIYEDGRTSTKKFEQLMARDIFQNTKSDTIIERIINFVTDKDDIVLDFFSGSGTTAQSVMQLNQKDGKCRKFILVQLPENMDLNLKNARSKMKKTLNNAMSFLDSIGKPHILSEIGKERIRRAGAKILGEAEEANRQIKLGEEAKPLPDVGFKVFKLDTSNVKLWDGTPTENEQLLFDRMNEMVSDIKIDRTDMDVVYEIMLKMGVPLTYKVDKIEVGSKPAYSVGDDCLLLICLAENVTTEDIEAMADYAPAKIILAESSLADDTAMANAHYILKDRSIELKLV